ncbi:glutathione S-transferase theta-1-like [Brachionichthys hirsutus]|uniref:glutathione S-transferase theta-1-like n=1 Tax=Brachionichthys hirsutus TaxID=412623 RepID=UPI0036048E0F
MALELYLDLASQPCRAVYMFAKMNDIPFTFKKVSLMEGEHFGEEFGKISIIRKVPAMRDGDFCLAESIAIMLYLAEKFKTPESWYPADLQQRSRVIEFLSWQHLGLRMHASKVFWFKLLIPSILGRDVPQEKLDSLMEDVNHSMKIMEEKFLQDKPFIAGDHITLADMVAVTEIIQAVASGMEMFKDRPKLGAWYERVQAAIGAELFDDTHKILMGVKEVLKTLDPSKAQFFRTKCLKMIS